MISITHVFVVKVTTLLLDFEELIVFHKSMSDFSETKIGPNCNKHFKTKKKLFLFAEML